MLNIFVFQIEFDMVQPSIEILWRYVYPSVLSVTITALANTKHLHNNERTTTFLVSAGRWLKQLGDFSHVTFSVRVKYKIRRKSKASSRHSSIMSSNYEEKLFYES
jgi:hypothetical protein